MRVADDMFEGSGAWLWPPGRPVGPAQQLLCFPYAGGGASAFRGWETRLPAGIDVRAVQLPGREWRRQEAPHLRVDSLLDALFDALPSDWFDRPYVLFGYSMGAVLAFEFARRARRFALRGPQMLVAAACRAPQLMRTAVKIYDLPDAQFVETMRRFGGTPEIVLSDPELLSLVLPVLRADFELLDAYGYAAEAPFEFPIIVYGGTRDAHATRADLASWRAHTNSEFNLRLFNGGHFFINESREQLLRTLAADLLLL